jgi:hypothetical protein
MKLQSSYKMVNISELNQIFTEHGMNTDCFETVFTYMHSIRVCIGVIGLNESPTTSMGTMASILALQKYCNEKNILIEFVFLTNENDLNRGYGTIIAKMMASQYKFTHLFFMDPMTSVHPVTLEKLLTHDKMMVGCATPKMVIKWDEIAKLDANVGVDVLKAKSFGYQVNYTEDRSVKHNLLKVKHLSTNCLLLKREAITLMIDNYPELKYSDDIGILSEKEDIYVYGFFLPYIGKLADDKMHYLSGDYAFMERWRKIKEDIYLDVTIPVTKIGSTSFQGYYLKSLNFQTLAQ